MANGETNPQAGHTDFARAEAERRIEKARRGKDTFLDLSGLGLTVVPESLGRLVMLQTLNLSNNQLTALPESLLNLTKLTLLLLHENPSLGLSDEMLGPKWNEITGPAQKEPKPPSEILEHCFGPRARAVYCQTQPVQPHPSKVSVRIALFTYFGMIGLVYLVFVFPLGLSMLVGGKVGLAAMAAILVSVAPLFPLGLAKTLPFIDVNVTAGSNIQLPMMVVYGIYVFLFGLFLFMRKRRAFSVLVFVLFIVLCLNMIGCGQCLKEIGPLR